MGVCRRKKLEVTDIRLDETPPLAHHVIREKLNDEKVLHYLDRRDWAIFERFLRCHDHSIVEFLLPISLLDGTDGERNGF